MIAARVSLSVVISRVDGMRGGSGRMSVMVRANGAARASGSWIAERGGRLFPDIGAATAEVLHVFTSNPSAAVARVRYEEAGGCEVTLYRRDDATIVAIGSGEVVDSVRSCLPLDGWGLYETPRPGTPLIAVKDRLGLRLYNLLAREGFSAIEELAAIPDAGLLEVRRIGMPSLEHIREIVGPAPGPSSRGGLMLTLRQVAELHTLLLTLVDSLHPDAREVLGQRANDFIDAVLGESASGRS
jgi:hypothetical protein